MRCEVSRGIFVGWGLPRRERSHSRVSSLPKRTSKARCERRGALSANRVVIHAREMTFTVSVVRDRTHGDRVRERLVMVPSVHTGRTYDQRLRRFRSAVGQLREIRVGLIGGLDRDSGLKLIL